MSEPRHNLATGPCISSRYVDSLFFSTVTHLIVIDAVSVLQNGKDWLSNGPCVKSVFTCVLRKVFGVMLPFRSNVTSRCASSCVDPSNTSYCMI